METEDGSSDTRQNALQLQQLCLFIDSSGIVGEAAVSTDNPVAGDEQGDGVMPYGPAHCLGRHMRQTAPGGNDRCDFSVGPGLPVRNGQKNIPYRLAEGSPTGREGGKKGRILTGEVDFQPVKRLLKNRSEPLCTRVGQGVGIIFLTLKPKTCK